jgi:exodeoxyribonuclease VII large subunit
MQPLLFDATPRYTVTDITRRVRLLFESIPELHDVWVEGELSNISRPASGHVYFTLKDSGAQLRCVMWRNDAARLTFKPTDGMSVEAFGGLGIYEAGGQYQLYVTLLRPAGEGALYAEFMRLKAVLEAEGLFNPDRKRQIPGRPQRIGIVTSPTGAALRDILHTLRRRYPLAEVIFAPTPVQGAEAPTAIVAALQALNSSACPDVILLARGGGSIEDLWAFNDEGVVRAVAASEAPVISGVGHETDFTLVDFVADLRAPTPTAAAELATPITLFELNNDLLYLQQTLAAGTWAGLERHQQRLADLAVRLRLSSPLKRLLEERQRMDDLSHRLDLAQEHTHVLLAARLAGMEKRLSALNPLAVLQRGYAVVTRASDEQIVTSPAQVQPGDDIHVRLRDGSLAARVRGE